MAKSPTPTDVDNYRHDQAKRRNIPTAENQALVPDDDKAVKVLRYPRNPDLDPQLVWRGKDAEDGAPLEVAAPPIYIQEKIHPRALIENLQRQSETRKRDGEPQIDFFHDFNGLEGDKEARTEFYQHDQNWQNRMILGDSLLVMGSLAEREALRGKVQCIYLDPPYGIKFNSNWQPSTKSRDVTDGKEASVSREPEVVRAFRDTWKDGIHSYLSYLRDRLVTARDLLSIRGSIFVQIGDENVHRVRGIMDEIFGSENFISQITITKTTSSTGEFLGGVSDYIIWFARDSHHCKYKQLYNIKFAGGDGAGHYRLLLDADGIVRATTPEERSGNLPEGASLITADQLQSTGSHGSIKAEGAASWFDVKFQGRVFRPTSQSIWKTSVAGMQRLERASRILAQKTAIRFVRKLDDFPAYVINNVWTDMGGAASKTYVVETTPRIVERCILMTTDPGDLVLDPTCGSGTTAFVAENWGRRWITIDTSRVALTLARARLMGAKYDYFHLRDSADGAVEEAKLTEKPPAEASYSSDIRHGFVYERTPHVTLKSIANNAEIDVIWEKWRELLEPLCNGLNRVLGRNMPWEEWEIPREAGDPWKPDAVAIHAKLRAAIAEEEVGKKSQSALAKLNAMLSRSYTFDNLPDRPLDPWTNLEAIKIHTQWWEARRESQKEIDASIARNADVELLYDRPIKAKGVVRVSGPFTVESLSPHRVLPLGEDPFLAEMLDAETESGCVMGQAPKDSSLAEPSNDFAQVVYDNLLASGVQNTKKGEAIKFAWLKPRVSRSGLVPFEGRYTEAGEQKRAAICIGPEYDTVGYDLVKKAAREAADLYDTLIVCGFAFAPEVDETRLNFGSLTVLKARMNQDLRMGDKLKATGAGNLFVIFGEPDLRVVPAADGMIQIEIKGMDIFDPTTGDVRSSGGADLKNDVAAWFIDDDYDEESFFVRQAYFVGQDPYDGLKRALKAEIDETAWEEINSTISRPFPKPSSGRICVKVINHFGDEVQKVFEV